MVLPCSSVNKSPPGTVTGSPVGASVFGCNVVTVLPFSSVYKSPFGSVIGSPACDVIGGVTVNSPLSPVVVSGWAVVLGPDGQEYGAK